MKLTKKFFYLFFLIFIFNSSNASNLSLEEQIEADLFDFNPDITAMDVTEPTITRGTKAETIAILTGLVDAQDILQNQVYKRTNPITRKNVVDYPIFQHFETFETQDTNFICIPFFSRTFNERYYKEYHELKDYVDLNQDDIIKKIDDLEFTTFDIPRVLKLFEKMQLQEHRIGLLFDWTKTKECWSLSLRFPLYYDEHNFYLNTTQRNQITAILGPADADFVFDHVVADFLALGDTKLCFEYLMKQDYRYELALGLRATLPTKIRIQKGLVGAYFNVDKQPQSLDLYTDILKIPVDLTAPTLAEQTQIINNVTHFGLEVLDHLSTILLEQGSRNYFHVGIGPQIHSTMHFNSKCYLTSLISLEVFTPAQEVRFFRVKNDSSAFNALTWSDTAAQIDEKLAFLNTQLKNKFLPSGYNTIVYPGIVLQSTSALVIKKTRVTWTLGSDFWLHSKEIFGTIYAPEDIKPFLDTEHAKAGNCYQSTAWIALDKNPQPDNQWRYGGKLSVGTWNYGIGSSVSFALYIEKMF